ncbi:MAG: YkgJ family cysteine cluster protein [Acidobacteria bacterium]|nr:YkgJ family cysteine cluster protein [Acidobacteriota bacterium]
MAGKKITGSAVIPAPPQRELRFACQPGCINCCNVQGYVYLTEDNLRDAARYLRMTAAEFEQRYVYRTRHLLRLRKPRHSQCHFLRGNGCSIHPAKPAQCRLFPFWPELVKSTRAWNAAARNCPGIGQGPLVQIGEALEIASEMERAYPTIYP